MFQHQTGERRLASGNERGFSIIEVCIALLILLIASLGVATAFAFSIHNNSSAGDRSVAAALAQREMERLRNLEFNDAALDATVNPVVQVVNSAGQPWANNGRPFRVTMTITDIDTDTSAAAAALPPTGKTIRIDVTPGGNSETWANGTVTLITTRSAFAPGPNFCGTC
jgi:prepilin-type N-terminal cleavage/methylation domain-containing protein